jgi:hypothetical protein
MGPSSDSWKINMKSGLVEFSLPSQHFGIAGMVFMNLALKNNAWTE